MTGSGCRLGTASACGRMRVLDASNADRLGPNLRQLRQERGMTLDRLAAESALTRGYLSLVERGLKTPSITALLRVATALGVNIAQLFDLNAAPTARYTLTRHGDARALEDGTFGLMPLAARRARKMMDPFLLTPAFKPGGRIDPRWAHGGEEFLFVVSGRVSIRLGSEDMELGPGDSLYFEGEIKHEVRSLGREKAQVLVVIALPASPPAAAEPTS
ncbi:helix-turn-helix XRE-family like protein [Azorhizobium caulinodans ORS 571]|uniref:Helix-turn-helix XRE-family like protein n=1 Tax=Azorhizobium caulinodans (strain ATCC 43989 / DSM 5975 / JCM 20966 / LMG 6465 / NBRC 14845 / NCIMB 13405 / ORS 571) TaxID=438753 RepID=A8I9H1_AZOC5|nr:helix-turn-helix XRE-family like protein [Azorhizobium caulinodans ORS 571]